MNKRNKLLIDEYPLMVLPSLAILIGLNEAIVLQQIHFWINNPKGGIDIDGERWVYNTYEEWKRDNFPFWSVRTIIRVFQNLEEMGLIISRQEASYDRKKYYRVHYDNLAEWTLPTCHNGNSQNGNMQGDNLDIPPLTETPETPETLISKKRLETFVSLFGKFQSENECIRWLELWEKIGDEMIDEISSWAHKKEIHLENRPSLLDSMETASINWKKKKSDGAAVPAMDGQSAAELLRS